MTITIPSGRTLPLKAKASGGFSSSAYNPPVGDLSFVAEPGFSVTGTVADLAEVTISGQDFGTKPPQRHFDRVDRYWANGTEVANPYGSVADGDRLPTSLQNADSPFLANATSQMESWLFRAAAARHGRTLGYQLESGPTGDMEAFGQGTTNAGFAGWPATQRDAEHLYLRFWHYQRYFDNDADVDPVMSLASSLSAGATQATLDVGVGDINNSVSGLEEFYIELDSGDLHYCQQVLPRTSTTVFDFSPGLPSTASSGNKVYRRKDTTMKLLRMRDAEGGTNTDFNAYALSGFRTQISNDKMVDEPGYTKGAGWAPGQWQLHELYIRAPKTEAEALADNSGYTKFARIDNLVRMNLVGRAAMQGYPDVGGLIEGASAAWPSSGIAITNFGFEQDRTHSIPNNFVRYSDIYVDNTRQRVEIGIGNDDLYQCSNREPCPIKTWSNSITVNLNALPFTEAELAQARIFVVGADDVPTLVGRIQ